MSWCDDLAWALSALQRSSSRGLECRSVARGCNRVQRQHCLRPVGLRQAFRQPRLSEEVPLMYDEAFRAEMESAFRRFMIPSVAARMVELINREGPKAHRKLVSSLYLFKGFRAGVVRAPDLRNVEGELNALLKQEGAMGLAAIVSPVETLDGRRVSVREIVDDVLHQGHGAFAVFPSGVVGLYESEEPNSSVFLVRR